MSEGNNMGDSESSSEPITALFIAALDWRRTWIREEDGHRVCYGPTSVASAKAAEARLLDVAAKVADLALTGEPVRLPQCPGECGDDCVRCGSGIWELMCDDCRFYAAQDTEPIEEVTR